MSKVAKRLHLYGRDARQIRRLAQELELQVRFYEEDVYANGEAAALRFLLLGNVATSLLKVARRGANRYWKTHGEGRERPW